MKLTYKEQAEELSLKQTQLLENPETENKEIES